MNLQRVIEDVQKGMIPAKLYSDPEIFDIERRRVFGHAWLFLAHESEIRDPGDYVVRRIVDDSFIICPPGADPHRVLFIC